MSPLGLHSALRVPADLTAVAFVRSAIACVLEREEWPAESAGRVLLASNEALTNAIEHGSPSGAAVEVLDRFVFCSPCFRKECPYGHECMREITVEMVLGAMERLETRRKMISGSGSS